MSSVTKKPTKLQIIGTVIGTSALTLGGASSVKEHSRNKVEEILHNSIDNNKVNIAKLANDPRLSEEQKILMVKIQTKYHLLADNIETNKRLHGFGGMPFSRLPLFGNTEDRLREIHEELHKSNKVENLEKIDKKLKELIQEFHVIMKKDAQEIQEEVEDGVSYISNSDIQAIQSYMRECLGIIKNELTIGNVSADYTATSGSSLDGILQEFIDETDYDKSKKTLKKLVNHYSDMYDTSNSELALNHLAALGKNLESGDYWKEETSKWALIGLLTLVSLLVIKKYGLPPLVKIAKRGTKGILLVIWGEILERLGKGK